MKIEISKNIVEAIETGYKYHVVNSNEVHSFKNKKEAITDLKEAIKEEIKQNTGFEPELIEKIKSK